jgi:hypothetical protein
MIFSPKRTGRQKSILFKDIFKAAAMSGATEWRLHRDFLGLSFAFCLIIAILFVVFICLFFMHLLL